MLKILVTILILVVPLGELARINIYNEVSTTVNDILASLVVFVWFMWIILKNKLSKPSKKELVKPILFFVLFAFLSLVFNYRGLTPPEFIISFLYLLRFISYAALYFIISGFDLKFKRKILVLLVISGTLIVLAGFIQYLFYPNLRNLYYLGWDEHIYRLFSTFLDPNFAGAFFVLFLIFVLGLFFYSLQNKKIFLRNFTLIIIPLTLISIYLTFSRSALITLIASTFVFLFLVKKLKWILVLIFVSLVFLAISSKSFYIENINLFRMASSEARIDSAKIAINIIKENPIFGVGFNSYRYAQIRYGFREEEKALKSHADSGTDNSFLFVISTTGIVGFMAYLYLLYEILKYSHLIYKDSKISSLSYYLSIVTIASFVGIIINSMFINSLFYSFIMLWLWSVLGLISDKD